MGILSNVAVRKDMLSSVKGSHEAYLEHIDIEKKKEESQNRRKELASENQNEKEQIVRKNQEEELKKIEGLRKSNKELSSRESKAEEMLQSSCAILDESNARMAKGLADKNLDEVEAAQKIIQLAQENRKKNSRK